MWKPRHLSREGRRVLVILLFFALFVGLAFFVERTELHAPTQEGVEVIEQTALQHESFTASNPVRLQIPTIGVDTTFEALGLEANQEIEVPESFETVGWYVHGPTPGELGPAVVLGHVDSKEGPAVFYSLGQLELGDTVEITREDGSIAIFEITGSERHRQDSFPTSLVYGDIDHAGLRLITCSGTYLRDQRRYDHNLIVFAELVEVQPAS